MPQCNLIIYDPEVTARLVMSVKHSAKISDVKLSVSRCNDLVDLRRELARSADLVLIIAHGSRHNAWLSKGAGPLEALSWEDVLEGLQVPARALVTLICGQNEQSHWHTVLPKGAVVASTNWTLENGGIGPLIASLFAQKDYSIDGITKAIEEVHRNGETVTARRTLRPDKWTVTYV